MKRYLPYLLCLAGLAVLFALMPLADWSLPRGVRVTRDEATVIARQEAQKLGIDLSKAWVFVTWEQSAILEEALKGDRLRRLRANSDPVVGPRMGNYKVVFYRRGLEKFPNWGEVYVSGQTGEVTGARVRARIEEPARPATEADLRAIADRFVASNKLPGVVAPVFDSARPTVLRNRTDWLIRYRTHSDLPTRKVAFYVGIHFIGNQFAGWMPLEEYADGSSFRGSGGEFIWFVLNFILLYSLLLILLVLFLKKYHAGEVGVSTASLLFGVTILLSIAMSFVMSTSQSVNTGMGPLDAMQTATMQAIFKFLFFDVPLSVVIFFAWAVGESYARERWGERLASFDAILRRDPLNATTGRSLLYGVLAGPAVAAGMYLVGMIPVALGLAWPAFGTAAQMMYGLGGPILNATSSAITALYGSVVMLLFVLAAFNKRRSLPLGIVVGCIVGAIMGMNDVPVAPFTWLIVFGFGAALVSILLFLKYDLLTAATALFVGFLISSSLPVLRLAEGRFASVGFVTFATPIVILLAFAIAALLTRREVVYTHEDLAPHVKRIIERERVKAEIDAANRIQAALLPQQSPNVSGASVASHYRAATEIGGDYFDFLSLPNGDVGIAFGDVAGHGLTSGIVMAMAKAALLVQVGYDSSPRTVLNILNDIVIRTAPKRMMMTFFFGILDPHTQSLRFSSAGHLDPYVFRRASGKLEELSSWGFPLGVRRRDPFREQVVRFQPGDRLILYSDGLIESVDDDGEPFGFDRFAKTIAGNGHLQAEELKKALLTAVRKFTRNRPPEDDQTLVVVAFEQAAEREALAEAEEAVGAF